MFDDDDDNNKNNTNNNNNNNNTNYLFQPIAYENLGSLNRSGLDSLSEVGRRLSASSQDPRETSFLFQWLSVLIQRYNSVLILESFCLDEDPDL